VADVHEVVLQSVVASALIIADTVASYGAKDRPEMVIVLNAEATEFTGNAPLTTGALKLNDGAADPTIADTVSTMLRPTPPYESALVAHRTEDAVLHDVVAQVRPAKPP